LAKKILLKKPPQDMDLITNNLHNLPGTFYNALYEGLFDDIKFKDFTHSILKLHSRDLSQIDRLKISIELWEIGFYIQRLLSNHYDKHDTYKIANMSNDQLRQLSQLIYYICNWFSYNKPMEVELLELKKW
jgi:hypothetical protein